MRIIRFQIVFVFKLAVPKKWLGYKKLAHLPCWSKSSLPMGKPRMDLNMIWNGRVTDTHHRVANDGHAIQSCQAIDLVGSLKRTGLQALNHLLGDTNQY